MLKCVTGLRGGGVVVLSSAEAIDDFESHLGEATEKFERNRGKYERVARTGTVTDLRTGDEKPVGSVSRPSGM